MADSGERRRSREDEDDDDDYTQGSEMPPPPSYNDAMTMELPSSSQRTQRQMGPRSLSQIDKYTTSWLFPLMMRVKTTLQGVRRQLKMMEDDTGTLGESIQDLSNKSYLGMLSLSVTGKDNPREGDMLSFEVRSLMQDPRFKEQTRNPERLRYSDWKLELRKDMMDVRSWLKDQQRLDRDWKENAPRVPAISNFEVIKLKNCMMKVDSHRSSIEKYRRGPRSEETNLVDYGMDMVLKMDMEHLWSLLCRIGDFELGQEDDGGGVDSDPEWEDDTEEGDDQGRESDVTEGDTDHLRQKRLDYYTKDKPPLEERQKRIKNYTKGRPLWAERSESKEDEEQGEGMLSDDETHQREGLGEDRRNSDGGSDNEAEDSMATRDNRVMSTFNPTTEIFPHRDEDRQESRLSNLYRRDRNKHGNANVPEEIEMVPAGHIVSQDDIEVETNSLPRSGSPDSYKEAISSSDQWRDVVNYSPTHSMEPRATVQQFEIDEPDTETGRGRRRSSLYDVGPVIFPFLREFINFVVRRIQYTKDHWSEYSLQKRLILVFSVLFVVGLVLLVSLLPASFVYVDYHEMGFVHNRATGKTDTDRVYEYGCYLMAPQHSLVLFPSTARFLDLELLVMNKAGLTIGLQIFLQYLLRPNELSQMYRKYNMDYNGIIQTMTESTVKNMAIEFSLDEYRLNRSMVESSIFHRLKRVLSGDCCNVDNDRYKRFQASAHHSQPDKQTVLCNADAATCDPGFHIDLAFFQMGSITIPDEVMNHYLKQITLRLETEKEEYIQNKAVEDKLTSLSVQSIANQANEIKEKARAERVKIQRISEASRLKLKEQSYVASLKKTFELLKITDEEEKASLLFLNTLKHIKDNLVAFSYNYDRETLMSP